MTAPIDLEALRAVLSVLKYEAGTIPFDSRDYGPQREQDVADIEDAHRTVQLALAELTTRRARDAEVEALVDTLGKVRELLATLPADCLGSDEDCYGQPYSVRDEVIHSITKRIAPFAGARP
jgi:hypothetical protein